ncbi:GAF domain-containing protein [filamentous cyanobacterium LEGE 11480]|uniref:histidine kinase n=1 Tax=Romeriopsis navalis LEGE 11480 TaxID=2777977 RepID=A0A928VNJ6_9CYAN|nr:ATP-binding protein [Romeriopsis navalis]MBE9029154.1 GAF domain-containing protein [Romeriopsis navalis LEGE 11480]
MSQPSPPPAQSQRSLLSSSDMTSDASPHPERALQHQLTQSNLLASMLQRIRQSIDLQTILTTTVTEVREFLAVDRVVVFQVFPDGTGKATAESVAAPWRSIFEEVFPPEAFPPSCYDRYVQGNVTQINDRANYEVVECMQAFMESFQIRAKLAVPIILGDRLWGLLLAHQCSGPRTWQAWEIAFVQQLAWQLEVPLDQAQLYQRLQTELQERKKVEAELRDLTLRLKRSNQELESFAYVSSHDLQEPLRKIQAFGDRLRSRANDALDDRSQDYLQRMLNASARAQLLIDNLLTFSRVTSKTRPFIPVNLRDIIAGVLSDLEVQLEKVNGQVSVTEIPEIEADSAQMRQLFQNLISNALKFSRAGVPPIVTITAAINQGQVQIKVTDNGIGFESKYDDRIFELFQRLHGRKEYEGSGIGLSICRKIVERHGGDITPHGEPGSGATFIINLPMLQHHSSSHPLPETSTPTHGN